MKRRGEKKLECIGLQEPLFTQRPLKWQENLGRMLRESGNLEGAEFYFKDSSHTYIL